MIKNQPLKFVNVVSQIPLKGSIRIDFWSCR